VGVVAFVLAALVASAPPAPPAKVMVLGVAHLVARHDIHNSAFQDSPLSPKRQAQINVIIERLARFHPTKVLIEAPFGDPVYAERYRQYLGGQFKLPANEIYQIGFKLAARAGDSSIYPIDAEGPALEDTTPSAKRILAFLSAHFTDVPDPIDDAVKARDDQIERGGTYVDVLRYLNTDAAIRANASWYSVMAGMGRSADNAGAAYVSQWYARNVYIFSNIASVVRPGDRVVVIMGQGHEYLLREFVRLNPTMTYINALDYL
jgi:hypothetical protein